MGDFNLYYIIFEENVSSNGMHICNSLRVDCFDRNGNEISLYTEFLIPELEMDEPEIQYYIKDDYTLIDANQLGVSDYKKWFDWRKFCNVSYPILKEKIIEQAKERNVNPDTLVFDYNYDYEKDGIRINDLPELKYDSDQMREIRFGVESGIDVSIYAKSEFTWEQMAEIREGLEKGIDVLPYAKPTISTDTMRKIRQNYEKAQNITWHYYPEFNDNRNFEIRQGIKAGIDVSLYAKPEFDWQQMREIREGLQNGQDVSKYADPKFNWKQMSEIRQGLENGNINVDIYADPKFNDEQMYVIRQGLSEGLDIQDASKYADPKYNFSQLCKIFTILIDIKKMSQYPKTECKTQQLTKLQTELTKITNKKTEKTVKKRH